MKNDQIETIIDKSMTVRGDLFFKGKTVLGGKIEGTIRGDRILVEESGTIIGTVTVVDLECHGQVSGDIYSQTLLIGEKASIKGNLNTNQLVVRSGAALDCTVTENTQQKTASDASGNKVVTSKIVTDKVAAKKVVEPKVVEPKVVANKKTDQNAGGPGF